MRQLHAEPLAAATFAPFGEVIEASGACTRINDGTAQHFADRAPLELTHGGGYPRIGIYRALPVVLPMSLGALERHPLGSQLFMPLDRQRFLIVVAPTGDTVDPAAIRAFVSNGRQGVNYRRSTWHHPLLALGTEGDFLVVDRGGEGANCDVVTLSEAMVLAPL